MKRIIIPIFAVLISAQFILKGDGETRVATAKEKEFYNKVMNAFKSALPKAPAGWEVKYETEISTPERVSLGLEASPYYLDYHIEFQDYEKIRTSEEKLNEELASPVNQTGGVDQKTMDDYSKLAEKIGEAVEKGDMEKAAALQKEMEKMAAVMESGFKENDEAIRKIVSKHSPKDSRLSVSVMCNSFGVTLEQGAVKTNPIGNHKMVFRSSGYYSDSGEWHEGVTTVVIGSKWDYSANEVYSTIEYPEVSDGPHTRVHTIIVTVNGSEDRARQYLSSINWTSLTGLISN